MTVDSKRQATPVHKHEGRRPPWMIIILMATILLTEIIFVLEERMRWQAFAAYSFNPAILMTAEPLYPAQPWAMFLSHIFVHIGPLHMLGNLLALYLLWHLMPWMHISDYLIVFVGGALGGCVIFLWLATPSMLMTGASGAVAALATVWAIYEMLLIERGQTIYLHPKRLTILVTLSMFAALFSVDHRLGMAWQVHLGGTLTGVCFGLGLVLRVIWDNRFRRF